MNKNTIINFVLFQAGWFACVLGATNQMPWLGVWFLGAFLVWHLRQTKNLPAEIKLIIAAVLIGGVYDQIMRHLGLLTYQAHGWSTALPAAWILALWAEFAMTLNVSLRWMKTIKSNIKWLIATLFGAIGGPFAYVAAARLGAVSIDNLPLSYIGLCIGWAVLTPLLVYLSTIYDGFNNRETTG